MKHKLLLALCLAVTLAACSSKPKQADTAAVEDRGAAAAAEGTQSYGTGTDAGGSMAALNDPSSPLAKRSVFFDFDSFVVRPEFQGVVEAHGRYLVANPARRVVIEGNADERGSREYNLALGQTRADAVKSRLRLLGAGENQMESVSFGEEKPAATGSDEASWAQNRR